MGKQIFEKYECANPSRNLSSSFKQAGKQTNGEKPHKIDCLQRKVNLKVKI
jgi:hypothetical protein